MKFDDPMDHVQMRDGSAYVGAVTDKDFGIKPGNVSQVIRVKRRRIVWIMMAQGGTAHDRFTLDDGSEIQGTVVDKTLSFKSDATGPLTLRFRDILAVQLMSTFNFD